MNSFKILAFIAILLFTVSCSEKKDFNSTEWKNWVETEATLDTRWLMHKDLLKRYELKGVSRDSILDLLGKPNTETNNKYYYQLGTTGRGINTGTMTITIENDTVVDIEVTDG
ncbi:MAG: hypothetical protein WBA41_31295 [Rivularia sp. (in: cyanobacteria)]